MKKWLIIQSSPKRTASTLLVNAIQGLIPELHDKRIYFAWSAHSPVPPFDTSVFVLKTHETDIDKLTSQYQSDEYSLFFICSQRKSKGIYFAAEQVSRPNVLVFDFDELNEREGYGLPQVVQYIYEKINSSILRIPLDPSLCLARLTAMNQMEESLRDKPFSFIDRFFHIHGHHRCRDSESTP